MFAPVFKYLNQNEIKSKHHCKASTDDNELGHNNVVHVGT
jgi:hypothetical protein